MCLTQYGRRVSEFCSRTNLRGVLLVFLLLSSTAVTAGQRWIRQPSDRNVTVGGNTTFVCEAEGVDSLTHIWTKGVNPIFVDGKRDTNVPARYFIEGKNNLVINGVVLDDDSFFSCSIFGFDSVQVKLTVQLPPGPPSISVNSSTSQLVEKSVITLTCSSRGGKPAPTFRWLRNGQLVNSAIYTPPPQGDEMGSSSSHITVTLSREDHRANYSCVVFNAANQNSPLITTRILDVQYSPSISIEPDFSPYFVKQGSNVKLICNIEANPSASSIVWKKDGVTIPGNLGTLSLNSIQKASSGNYTCTASNTILGDTHSSTSYKMLTVIYAPTVTTQNIIVANISTAVNMTCIVNANPPAISITWNKLDGPITAPGPSFNFIAQRRYDGNYSCTAVSKLQPSGQPAEDISSKGYTTIKIQYPPGPASISSFLPVLVGQPIVLTCSLDEEGYPRPRYVWRRVGNPTPLQSTTSPVFRISSATLADNGNYTCTPTNIMGEGTRANAEVEVNSAPVFTQSLPSQSTYEVPIDQSNLLIEHKIEGRPLPVVQWYKDGIPLAVMGNLYNIETTNIIVEQYKYKVTTSLTFVGSGRDHTKLRVEDIGNYTCQVSSAATVSPAQRSTFLSILFKPEIIQHDRVASNVTETAILRCIVQGNPPPMFSWFKQGTRLEHGAKYQLEHKKMDGIEKYEGLLRVRGVVQEDFGEYACEVVNQKGSAKQKVHLSPRGKPDSPTNLASLDKTWESVKLHWESGFDGGYAQSFFIAVRSVHGENTVEVRPLSATEFNVTRLMPHTSYTFHVFGQNNAGQGRYSNGFTAQTEVLAFPPLKEIPQYRVEEGHIEVPNELNHSYCLRIEVSTDNGKVWNTVEPCVMAADGVVPLAVQSATNVNVSVCLVYRPEVCGEPTTSAIHEGSTPDLSQTDVIIIGCVCAGILVILLIILIIIICRRQKRKNNYTNDPHSPRTVQQGNGALPNQKRVFDNPGMGRVELSHGSHSNMGTLTHTNNVPNGGSNMPDIAVNHISYGVPLDNRNDYPPQYLPYGDNFPMEDTSYDSYAFDKYEYEMNRRNANISDPYYEKQQQGDISFTGSPRTPTKDPQQFIHVPEEGKNEGGSFGSGHESGYSTPDPAKPKKIWRLRPSILHFPHISSKQKGKGHMTNPDMVPYSHNPPGHTCGLPCCCEDLQIQLRVRRQPRSCIGIQENDVIQQNFTFKGRMKKIPSLENGFYSVQQPKEVKHGDIPKFGSVSRLSKIPEERKNYNFLRGRGITLPESNIPDVTEKVYLQGFPAGESDDILELDSESEIEYYMTVKGPTEPDRGVPYTHHDLDLTRIYPWDLLKEIRDKAKSGDKSDDSSSSNYYEVLRYPEEEPIQNKTSSSNVIPECRTTIPPPPDVPPKLPQQNKFNHPPLPKDKDKTSKDPDEILNDKHTEKSQDDKLDEKTKESNEIKEHSVDQKVVRFPHLELANTNTKYNTYNSVHNINSMANKSSRAAYDKYVSVSRSSQVDKPFHRDARDIDFTGSDNPRHGRLPKFTNRLSQILQRNDNSIDGLDKAGDIELSVRSSTFPRDMSYGKTDKTALIQENWEEEEEEEEGITNAAFKNIRIDGKILGSRNSIIDYDDTSSESVYHGSLRHGEIDGQMLSEVIKAAGFSDSGLKYFHVDDIDSDKLNSEQNKTALIDSPITLIL